MEWIVGIVFVMANFSAVPPAPKQETGDAQELLPAGTPMEELCRTLHLRSRYCRSFRLPELSFDRLERAERRRQERFLRETSRRERRFRASFWLPEIALEWGQVDLRENASNWQAGQDFDSRMNQEYRNFWKICASWNLRGVAHDSQELQRERQLHMQMEYMQKKVDRIRRTYYQWFHEVLEYRRNPSLVRLLRCEELEAELNSLTSGAFSGILGHGT